VNEHDRLVDRAARNAHTVLFVGGLDAGKSTLARAVAAYALTLGRSVSYLDGDLGQKTVGPPGTVGMKRLGSADDLTFERLAVADALAFVGSISPQSHLLPLVTGMARLHGRARADGSDLIVVDTSGMVSGIYGQLVKYHKVEMLQPDLIVGLQRGEELDPLLGILQRFFSVDVVSVGVHPSVVPSTVEQRAEHRQHAMARYFDGQLNRFRIRPTVFMPALPPMFNLAQLDRLLVGLSDGEGGYSGVGYLEQLPDEGALRLNSPVADPPKALRLGSVRLEESYRVKRVDLRNLFGTE
jgi:polynucleotide 5'-kinase involved in rRNA processing